MVGTSNVIEHILNCSARQFALLYHFHLFQSFADTRSQILIPRLCWLTSGVRNYPHSYHVFDKRTNGWGSRMIVYAQYNLCHTHITIIDNWMFCQKFLIRLFRQLGTSFTSPWPPNFTTLQPRNLINPIKILRYFCGKFWGIQKIDYICKINTSNSKPTGKRPSQQTAIT